jgi:hypothetical protein
MIIPFDYGIWKTWKIGRKKLKTDACPSCSMEWLAREKERERERKIERDEIMVNSNTQETH